MLRSLLRLSSKTTKLTITPNPAGHRTPLAHFESLKSSDYTAERTSKLHPSVENKGDGGTFNPTGSELLTRITSPTPTVHEKKIEPVKSDRWEDLSPMEMSRAIPPVKVPGNVAVCDGGGGALGHPKVYIKLDPPVGWKRGTPVGTCRYCGLRFFNEKFHSHDGHGDEQFYDIEQHTF